MVISNCRRCIFISFIHSSIHPSILKLSPVQACYRNLCRRNSENLIGAESGASFFLAEYGIRIINLANGFLGWKVSKWHGTGWYCNETTQLGMSLLLAKAIEDT
jgi:hypothetical protein